MVKDILDNMSETTEKNEIAKKSCPTIQETFKNAKKIVIKIGSNTLASSDGKINIPFMESFAKQCANLMKMGKQIVIVSSGAQVAGLSTIDRWERKKDIHYRQALCAIGQVELMDNWRNAFWKNNIHIGQLLLTKDDFQDSHRTLNMRNTLFTLVDEGVVPIINENDSVSTEEIRIGDNDNLSALTSILWNADLLILFSDIDGVYTDNPKTNPDAKLIEYVESMEALRSNIQIGSANSFGTGGMNTKLEAADKLTSYGIPMILANGAHEKVLEKLSDGSQKATLFCAD